MTFLTLLQNPRVLAAVALVAALAGAYLYVDHRAFKRGAEATETRWQAREAQELARLNVEIERLNREARAVERVQAESLAAIASRYERDLQNAKRARDTALAAVRAGQLVLRDPATTCQDPGARAAGAPPASAGGRHGAAGGQLSSQAAEFLLQLTAEADDIVRQLTACQSVVAADRAP